MISYLNFLKKYQNIDMYIVLLKELDFSDEDIIELLKVSKGSIHNARKRLQPLLNSLEAPEW